MPDQENIFQAFPSNSAEEWKDKIIQELKGKPFDDLNWDMGSDIKMAPFYTQEDSTKTHDIATKQGNDWEIAEDFHVGADLKVANTTILEALLGGVNAPRVFIQKNLTQTELDQLLHKVEPQYISLHFRLSEEVNQTSFIDHLSTFLKEKGQDIKKMKGSIMGLDFQPNWQLKTLGVDATAFYQGIEHSPKELAKCLKLAVDLVMSSLNEGEISDILSDVFITIRIGTSYFPSIAKIRALKVLWQRVSQGFDVGQTTFEIEAEFAPEAFDAADANTNMIRATTMAMSAVVGGADRLIVLPSDAPSPFTRRIARNVQHLLKMESFMDKVADPASGSYYIEQMTSLMVEKAWEAFIQMESKGY